jgi:nucleoside-diphosphate-sugar epimerase
MTDLYCALLALPADKISGKKWNAGYENHTVSEIADIVKEVVGQNVKITTSPTDDNRSYHISSEKIKNDIGFIAKRTIEDAVKDLKSAFDKGLVPDSLTDDKYFNVKRMQKINMK